MEACLCIESSLVGRWRSAGDTSDLHISTVPRRNISLILSKDTQDSVGRLQDRCKIDSN